MSQRTRIMAETYRAILDPQHGEWSTNFLLIILKAIFILNILYAVTFSPCSFRQALERRKSNVKRVKKKNWKKEKG